MDHTSLDQNHNQLIMYDWVNKWLKGDEYSHILLNADLYCDQCDFKKYPAKTHPKNIYLSPISTCIIRWSHILCQRTNCWIRVWLPKITDEKAIQMVSSLLRKKMNFTTDLPKSCPIVSYIVASAVKCDKFFPGCEKEGPCFRMHAVVLKNKGRRLI